MGFSLKAEWNSNNHCRAEQCSTLLLLCYYLSLKSTVHPQRQRKLCDSWNDLISGGLWIGGSEDRWQWANKEPDDMRFCVPSSFKGETSELWVIIGGHNELVEFKWPCILIIYKYFFSSSSSLLHLKHSGAIGQERVQLMFADWLPWFIWCTDTKIKKLNDWEQVGTVLLWPDTYFMWVWKHSKSAVPLYNLHFGVTVV